LKESLAGKLKEIPLQKISEPGGRIRLEVGQDALRELADNIGEIGLLQPIIVRPIGERFEIIAGHRRFLAFKILKRKKIPCIIRESDDAECAVARASENLRRVDLTPIEEAAIYEDLRENYKLTPDEIGRRMGKTAGIVKRRLDLLKMPPQLQKAIHLGQISYGVAEELWRLEDEGSIDYYLGYAVDHGVTVSVARQWVMDHRKSRRRAVNGVGPGGEGESPLHERPIYIGCETCGDPVELGKDTVFRCCPGCASAIREALKQSS